MTRMLRLSTTAGLVLLGAVFCVLPASAARTLTYAAYFYNPAGVQIGEATLVGDETGGVLFRIDITGLPPGKHGMHIHEYGSCNPLRDTTGKVTVFGAAGGHFDPEATGHHLGPEGPGHAGDLPNLDVSLNGHARTTFYSDRLSVFDGQTDIVGRSIVIHEHEDNYTDLPPNGGSGARIACGEIGPIRVQ